MRTSLRPAGVGVVEVAFEPVLHEQIEVGLIDLAVLVEIHHRVLDALGPALGLARFDRAAVSAQVDSAAVRVGLVPDRRIRIALIEARVVDRVGDPRLGLGIPPADGG
ncbi:MAG: hypothetical protein A2Y77_02595 [Planctomycetes bacterium RBG_13_62_9]|nr:MAG: hypothetical protein A2Y77_02595 [Planctomycetes bacterium RBG_13_62_9]